HTAFVQGSVSLQSASVEQAPGGRVVVVLVAAGAEVVVEAPGRVLELVLVEVDVVGPEVLELLVLDVEVVVVAGAPVEVVLELLVEVVVVAPGRVVDEVVVLVDEVVLVLELVVTEVDVVVDVVVGAGLPSHWCVTGAMNATGPGRPTVGSTSTLPVAGEQKALTSVA